MLAQLNWVLLELRRHCGGPIHINFETIYNKDPMKGLSAASAFTRITNEDKLGKVCKMEKVTIISEATFSDTYIYIHPSSRTKACLV